MQEQFSAHQNMSTDSSCTCIFKNCLKRIFRQFKKNGSTVDLQYFVLAHVLGVQQSDSLIHVSVLFQLLVPCRLLQNIEYSSLCYTAHPCSLPILYIVSCMG